MYGIDGKPTIDEFHLDHLEGYKNSRPVRIGSTNHGQKQWDIYGELMDSVYLYDKYAEAVSYDLWMKLTRVVDHVCAIWNTPDSGIWEVRSGNQEFLFSRVMSWVAVDRACRMAIKRSLPAPLNRWLPVRDRIYHSVFKEMWSEKRQAFTQYRGGEAMDASALIMPLVKFIGPTDPRWLSTLRAIETDLVEDSLVYRYNVGEAFSDQLEGRRGDVLHLLLLVHRVRLALRRSTEGSLPVREDAGLRQRGRAVLRAGRASRRVPGERAAGLHAPGVDQHGVRSEPAAGPVGAAFGLNEGPAPQKTIR